MHQCGYMPLRGPPTINDIINGKIDTGAETQTESLFWRLSSGRETAVKILVTIVLFFDRGIAAPFVLMFVIFHSVFRRVIL